jgi:hypothetical protein
LQSRFFLHFVQATSYRTVPQSLPPHPFSTIGPCRSSSPLSVSAHQTTCRCLAARHKPKLRAELKLKLNITQ